MEALWLIRAEGWRSGPGEPDEQMTFGQRSMGNPGKLDFSNSPGKLINSCSAIFLSET